MKSRDVRIFENFEYAMLFLAIRFENALFEVVEHSFRLNVVRSNSSSCSLQGERLLQVET